MFRALIFAAQVKELAKKSKSVSPLEGRVKRSSEASDITGRIKRVREAISAVETQLRTTVLKGRRWENLDQQDQMLTKVGHKLFKTCGLAVEKSNTGAIRVGDFEASREEVWAGGGGAEQREHPDGAGDFQGLILIIGCT